MSVTGGGQESIEDLVRAAGEDALWKEAEALGLQPRAGRCRCPMPGCADKGTNRTHSVSLVGRGHHPRLHCHRCEGLADLVDLFQLSRGLTRADAVAYLRGQPVLLKAAPQLRVVSQPTLEQDAEKLTPQEVRRLWDALAREDAEAQAYLEGRGLIGALELGLVRFATEKCEDKELKKLGGKGYRVAVLQTDVVGNPRGIQFRNVRSVAASSPKMLSAKGSAPKRGFFGTPDLIESSDVVAVTEGLADTLAVAAWAADRPGTVVVGAAGKGFLAGIAEQLAEAAIPLQGKVFALFVQNDAPKNQSRREFVRLAQKLKPLGAEVALISVPDAEYKDVADWRERFPEADWPPRELARVLVPEPGDDSPREAQSVLSPGCAVALPANLEVPLYTQSFSTLCALLADPVYRTPVAGPGELELDEMTGRVRLGGRPLLDIDLSALRLGLERECKTTEGKPLKFSEDDIARALELLARRKTVHPVRTWLSSLEWDGKPRMDEELPKALGQEAGTFACTLLAKWLISAVARPLAPGCKVDTVLVLVGERQGEGKSSFFSALAGDEWFTDSPVNVADKDGKLLMREKWIVEWAELDSMRRARDKEAVRAFLSQRVDHFRAPYGRSIITAPRTCVIVGSTNSVEFLSDYERRFWPVHVTQLDLAWVRANRDQLLAEAVARYRAAEPWHLSQEEHEVLSQIQQAHREQHPWAELIEDWLSGRPALEQVTTTQVLVECLERPEGQVTRAESMAVAGILRERGWQRALAGGRTSRRYVYLRPHAQDEFRGGSW